MASFLDKNGLSYFWNKIKSYLSNSYYIKSEADGKYQVKGDYASIPSVYSNQNIGSSQVLPSINVREIKVFSLKNIYSGDVECTVKLPSGGDYLVVRSGVNSPFGSSYAGVYYYPGGSEIGIISGTYGICGFYIRLS